MLHGGEDRQERKDTLDRKGVEFLTKHTVQVFPESDFVRKMNKPWFDASDEFSAVHSPGLHIDSHTTLPTPSYSHVEYFFKKLDRYQEQIDQEKGTPPFMSLSFQLEDNEPLHVKLSSWEWFKAFLDINEMFPGTIVWQGRLEKLNPRPIPEKNEIG